MEEQIEDIAKQIKKHRELEISVEANNEAVGRVLTTYNNSEKQFWLINKEATSIIFQKDIKGNDLPQTGYHEYTTYQKNGTPVPKHSVLGGLLIQFHNGKHPYLTPNGEIEIEIFNRATYSPSINEGTYASDILINIAGQDKTHSYQDLAKILLLQEEIDKDKVELEQLAEDEADQLRSRIKEKEEIKKTYLHKAQNFIRKYAELRYQPILDPLQEAIKRSKIFEGSLIINGGPGTGKTTSLIQRIKFLISPTIEEYISLTQSQKLILYNQKTSWIFYSPNELLALFLRNSMQNEELTADTARVKVWTLHKNELIRNYRFVTEDQRPFLIYNKFKGVPLFVNNAKIIESIIYDFSTYYINFQKSKLERITEMDIKQFKWKNTGISIQKYIVEKTINTNLNKLIRLYLNLEESYKKESGDVSEEYKELVDEIASRIQVVINKNQERVLELSELFKKWKIEALEIEDDDVAENELEDFDENDELASFDFERELYIKLKSLCRKQSLKKYDKNTRFNKRDKELLKLIPEIEEQNDLDSIGQTAFFKKYLERITKGIEINLLGEIPMIYKKFRREQLALKSGGWNEEILENLVKKDSNSRIHSDEQALLLIFTNKVGFTLATDFKRQYDTISHSYINSYKKNVKPVIGIDEATDFSIIDLLAINSLKHPEFSSVTLSGDIMQRMTSTGLHSWEDYTSIITDTLKQDLLTSYRQSPTLLSLAQLIYEKSVGKKANYHSFIKKDNSEPKPLLYKSENEEDKLEWISKRIIEIHKAYGNSIPSIAIFLPDEFELEHFASKLGNIDTLADVGILVKASRNGEVLGDKNTVRVFSIDKIKGLEFEAVFFHNLDRLQELKLHNELLLKYLYVGLSRATFYFAITVSKELQEELRFLSEQFNIEDQAWSY